MTSAPPPSSAYNVSVVYHLCTRIIRAHRYNSTVYLYLYVYTYIIYFFNTCACYYIIAVYRHRYDVLKYTTLYVTTYTHSAQSECVSIRICVGTFQRVSRHIVQNRRTERRKKERKKKKTPRIPEISLGDWMGATALHTASRQRTCYHYYFHNIIVCAHTSGFFSAQLHSNSC